MTKPALSTRSELSATPQAPAGAERLSIVQVGPALTVRGGITAVERLIQQSLGELAEVRHVASTNDGSPLHKLRTFLRGRNGLRALCAGREPLVVHIHFASQGSTLRKLMLSRTAAAAGHRVVLHAHGGGFAEFLDRLPASLRGKVISWLRSADHLIVLSSQWQRFYRDVCGVDAQRITVLANPVRLPQVVPLRAPHDALRIVYLGRMSESKGTFDLLRAVGRLPAELARRVELTVAGDGAVAQIRALAATLPGKTTVLEWVDEAARNDLLTRADAFALPSYAEGVPMSLLEAMAYGLPSVTTPVGGIPDVLRNGVEGLLVTPGDIEALSNAIASLFDAQRRSELGRHARERAKQYDLRDYGARLMDIYRNLEPSPARVAS